MATLLFLHLPAIRLRYGSLFSVSWSRILHVAVLIIVVALLYFYHPDILMSMFVTIPLLVRIRIFIILSHSWST